MKLNDGFGSAFRRAASFFPSAAVAVEGAGETVKADGFCVVSYEPAIVALTFAPGIGLHDSFLVSAGDAVRLTCRTIERKEVGDHVMVLAAVEGAEIKGGEVPVRWRGATFGLKLEYPFLDGAERLETFVKGWQTGSLPKSDWTHAAHVGVTGYFAFDRTAEEVLGEMGPGIRKYNVAVGGVNGPDSGYHETLTRFWSNTIARAVHELKPPSRLEAALCAVRIFGEDRDLPSLFYSFNVARDQRARREWVAPGPATVAGVVGCAMRWVILPVLTCGALLAQDPYVVAGNHYRLAFENRWVRATRVIYGPHETAPTHTHPANPVTVYVYVTDGGVMQFHHESGNVAGVTIDRKPVKAGGIRVAHGAPETHTVKYLGDEMTEYARLELRTEPIDRPTRDVRLPPYTFDKDTDMGQQFENGQLRIVRIRCEAGQPCPESEHAKEPAVVVVLSGAPSGPGRGEILWSPSAESLKGPMELVRIELKSSPVAGH